MPPSGYVFEVSSRPEALSTLAPSPSGGVQVELGHARAVLSPSLQTLGDEPTVIAQGNLLVVVHGLIDYRRDLDFPCGPEATTAEIVAEAFRRGGDRRVQGLAGDFTAVVWDEAAKRLAAYRTFPGPYPLFYSTVSAGASVAVLSSSVSGVLAHPNVDPGLNRASVAESASGLLFGEHGETCRSGIRVLDSGWALIQQLDARAQRIRAWKPTVDVSPGARSEGADALLECIRNAVLERAAKEHPTAIWLSGGFDSSAVFAAAMSAQSAGTVADPQFKPISITYPEGDIAREDEWIRASLARWDMSTSWVESGEIPVRTDFEESAKNRDLPFVHLFDTWNGALADQSRAVGARVALGGDGGDQLFQCVPIHLADLARTIRPVRLVREYRSLGGQSLRGLARWSVLPLVPRPLSLIYEGFRGIPFQDTQRVAPPAWIRPDFVKRHGLLERNREVRSDHVGRSRAAREVFRLASSPFFGRVATEVRLEARRRGVLHRSPLWDRRVVEFALRRPFAERVERGESKQLLRSAMRGLIPDEVLAPRSQRTGAPDSVFHRFMRDGVLPASARLGRLARLADLGIVDPNAFDAALSRYRESPSFFMGVQIAFSVDTECWLRGLA